MTQTFRIPDNFKIFRKRLSNELMLLGVNSLGIIALISVFMGAVISIQTAAAIESPLIPKYMVGFTTRHSVILEFSPTMISLILAGKIGSNIASEIGSMRLNEQIDALDIMGVNSANLLLLPKILASILMFPFLVIISMGVGIIGGWFAVAQMGIVTNDDFIYGIQYDFENFWVTYALIKTVVFAFVITSVSSFYGYYVKPSGGALSVGKASTSAVESSIKLILMLNLLITQLLLI